MRKPVPKQTSDKPIRITLDGQLGLAIRQYIKDVKVVNGLRLTQAELVDRALICYWLKQKTAAANDAVNKADSLNFELAHVVGEEDGV